MRKIEIAASREASVKYRDLRFHEDRQAVVSEWTSGEGYSLFVGPMAGLGKREEISLSLADWEAVKDLIAELKATEPAGLRNVVVVVVGVVVADDVADDDADDDDDVADDDADDDDDDDDDDAYPWDDE